MIDKDLLLAKLSTIKRCLNSIVKVTENNPEKLEDVFVQDVFVINLQRAVQASLDIANILISYHDYELPTSYKNSFQILANHKVISKEIQDKLIKMIGFRNIAVHDYQTLDLVILKKILEFHLGDFDSFMKHIHTNYILDKD